MKNMFNFDSKSSSNKMCEFFCVFFFCIEKQFAVLFPIICTEPIRRDIRHAILLYVPWINLNAHSFCCCSLVVVVVAEMESLERGHIEHIDIFAVMRARLPASSVTIIKNRLFFHLQWECIVWLTHKYHHRKHSSFIYCEIFRAKME